MELTCWIPTLQFDSLARSVSSEDGSALADIGIIVRVLAEKTKKPKKKLTLMEAILQQRATLRNNQKENQTFFESSTVMLALCLNSRLEFVG